MSNIVYNDGAVCVSVVHGSKRLVAFLTSGIPDLKLDGGALIKRNSLCQEGSANGRFAIGIELILKDFGELLVLQ